jgi:hypothetical protein
LPLALATGTSVLIFLGAYVLFALIAFAIRPRDVYGRRRAAGCLLGLIIFFGLFVAAFAAWAAHHVF